MASFKCVLGNISLALTSTYGIKPKGLLHVLSLGFVRFFQAKPFWLSLKMLCCCRK